MRSVTLLLLVAAACTQKTELLSAADVTFCSDHGPPIRLGGGDDAHCAGALAARFGRYALCTCNDLVLTGALSVSGLRMGGGHPGPGPDVRPPGAVGSDGNMQISGAVDVAGTLLAAGTGGIQLARGGHLHRNVRSAGNLATQMGADIMGSAFAAGDVLGRFVIDDILHVSPVATVGANVVASAIVREAISVESPCQCGEGALFDIAAAVAARKSDNANDRLSFSPDLLKNLGEGETLDWSCGQYYLPEMRTRPGAPLELRIHGRVGIFVDGDLHLGDNLAVTLDPEAELDLVVAGSLFTTGRLFGSPAMPSSTRLWVAGSSVSLPDQIQLGAVVYAPEAVFSAGPGLAFSGALFAMTLSIAGNTTLAYDSTVATSGQACGAAPLPMVE